jgi:hypothetical protein
MRRPNRQWRDDRLGSVVSTGLRPVRTAEPSDAVWSRIASELGPRREASRGRATFQRASVLSLVLLVGAGIAGVGSLALSEEPTQMSFAAGGRTEVSEAEEARLAAGAAGAWDRILPPEPLPIPRGAPKEAYNRTLWQGDGNPTGAGGIVPWLPIFRQ